MSIANFIKKLIKANALFGGRKIKTAGIPDGDNYVTDLSLEGVAASNKFILSSTPPDWLQEGTFFRIKSGGGANQDLLFRVGSIVGNEIFNDDALAEVSAVSNFGPGTATVDARIWVVVDDATICKKSLESNNTIFNVNNLDSTGLLDGSGIAENFAEHYHDVAVNIEGIEDLVAAMFQDTDTIGWTYNDPASTLEADFIGDAEDVPYDNTSSGLAATDVQAAIDEVYNTVIANDTWQEVVDNSGAPAQLDLDLLDSGSGRDFQIDANGGLSLAIEQSSGNVEFGADLVLSNSSGTTISQSETDQDITFQTTGSVAGTTNPLVIMAQDPATLESGVDLRNGGSAGVIYMPQFMYLTTNIEQINTENFFGSSVTLQLDNATPSAPARSFALSSTDGFHGGLSMFLGTAGLAHTFAWSGSYNVSFENDGDHFLFDSEIGGGTALTDDLILVANTQPWGSSNSGLIRLRGQSILEIDGDLSDNPIWNGLSHLQTHDMSGSNIIALNMLKFAPTFENINTTQFLTNATSYNTAGIYQISSNIGPHTLFNLVSIASSDKIRINHNTTSIGPQQFGGFQASPEITNINSTTGTSTFPEVWGFSTYTPNFFTYIGSPLLSGNHTVTEFNHFVAHGNVPGGMKKAAGFTITEEVGLNLKTLIHGTTITSIKSNSGTAHMRHAGNVLIGASSGTVHYPLDVIGNIRIRTTNTLRFGGTGASDDTGIFNMPSANYFQLTKLNGTRNGGMRIDLETNTDSVHLIYPVDSTDPLQLDYGHVTVGDTSQPSVVGSNHAILLEPGSFVAGSGASIATLVQCSGDLNTTMDINGESVSNASTLRLTEPGINLNGGSVTNASILEISGSAPTEGSNNYALFVTGGNTVSRFNGELQVGTGFGAGISEVNSNTTLDNEDYTILVEASSGVVTITLPPAANHTNRIYNIKKIDNSINSVTIDGNASETIDGATTVNLTIQYESITLQCDGTEWWIIG